MSAKRRDLGIETVWNDDALRLYESGLSVVAVTMKLNETVPVSSLQVRNFLRSKQIIRNNQQCQRLKRWKRKCKICESEFEGRTPTVIICDVCYGDATPGMTLIKIKKFSQYMAPLLRNRNYGVDVTTFNAMLTSQDNRCGLCKKIMKSPCVDHDHETNVVRGLLCHRCNLTLGHVENAGGPTWLMKASTWLQQGKGQ